MPDLLSICLCFAFSFGGPAPSMAGGIAADGWLGEDKGKHFVTSAVVTVIAGSAARTAGLDAGTSRVAGAAVATGAGVAKEINDHRQPGNVFSVRDLAWNLAGVAAGYAVLSRAR
jgi:putative lipoprotein